MYPTGSIPVMVKMLAVGILKGSTDLSNHHYDKEDTPVWRTIMPWLMMDYSDTVTVA